jgi:hypothetical protein
VCRSPDRDLEGHITVAEAFRIRVWTADSACHL